MPKMDGGRVETGERRGPLLPDEDNAERIRHRAHQIWEEEGRPEGRDQEHWRRAAREILGDPDRP
ncbi:MAG: DUF2934 domain-containing protein [Pseudomonadota bacterium]